MHKIYIYLLSASHLVTDLGPGALPAILPFFVLHYGLSYTEVAGLLFACSALSSLVQPVFGLLADKSDKHWLMGFGVLITGAALSVTGFTNNYWIIFASVTVMGVGSSIFHPQAARFVNYISGDKKSTGIGIFSVGGNAGFGLAPLIAIWTISAFGLPGVSVFGLLSVSLGVVLLLLIPKLVALTEQVRSVAQNTRKAVKAGTNDWNSFLRLTLVICARSIVFCALSGFIPLYCIGKFGVTEAVAGTTLTVFACGCTVMTLLGGWLGDRYGLVRTMRWGSLALIPGVAAVYFAPSMLWIYPVLVFVSFGINVPYASFVVLGQTYLARNIGFASGVTLGLSFSVGGIFVPVLGRLADTYSLDTVMLILVALSALSAVGAYLLKTPKRG